MTYTNLPLKAEKYRAPTTMITLPSIRELGLWGSERADYTLTSPSLGHSVASTPRSHDAYAQRSVATGDYDSSSQYHTGQTSSHFTWSSDSTGSNPTTPSYFSANHRPRVSTLEPAVTIHKKEAIEDYTLSSDWRRCSADSVASTPSLVGSFTSSCSSSDSASPALTPSTPRDFQNSAYFWDLSAKQHLQQGHVAEYDNWPKVYLRDPWSSRSPRRTPRPSKAPESPRGSQQPAYRVQKRERAKPKNNGLAHCNEKYTMEENRFLIYFRVDRPLSWQQLEVAFNKRFPATTRPYRTDGGLQSQFYRLNTVCPEMTDNKLLIFGPGPEHGKKNKFNEYDNLTFDCKVRGGGKVSLIDRYAEQIVDCDYSWITPEDMLEAKKLAARRRPYRLAWEAQKKAGSESQSQLAKL